MKQRELESRELASAVNLIDVSGLLSIPELVKHYISEECLTLFNATGTVLSERLKLLQELSLGMIWHLASPTAEERVKSDGFPCV